MNFFVFYLFNKLNVRDEIKYVLKRDVFKRFDPHSKAIYEVCGSSVLTTASHVEF